MEIEGSERDDCPTSLTSDEPDLLTAAASSIGMAGDLEEIHGTDDPTGMKTHDADLFLTQRIPGLTDGDALQRNVDINLDDFVDVITTYNCKFCDFSCALKTTLIDHLRSVHIGSDASSQALIFLCGVCNEGFLKLDVCKLHMMQEHPPEGSNIDARNPRRRKVRDVHRSKPQTSENECQNVTSDPSMTKRKTRIPKAFADYEYTPMKKQPQRPKPRRKDSDGNKALKCEMAGCNGSFQTKEAFDFHVRCHVTANSFRCPECSRMDDDWRRMTSHACRSRAALNLQCSECGRTFADSKCLRKHKVVVHGKLKPYVCEVCGHASARKAMLALHVRRHTAEKPYKCDQCDFATVDPSTLRRHRMRHSGEKRYRCPHCPYACIQTISYKMHLKVKHPGLDGLYRCKLCPYLSVNRENHLIHERTHEPKNVGSVCVEGRCQDETHQQTVVDDANVERFSERPPVMDTVFAGNGTTAAPLVYTCLNALSPSDVKGDETAKSQTVTIQLSSQVHPNPIEQQPQLHDADIDVCPLGPTSLPFP